MVDGAPGPVANSYTFTSITANHTIAVTFAIDILTINASAGAGGSITPLGAVPVDYGSTPTFNIAANSGFYILDVVVNGQSVLANLTFANFRTSTSYTFTGVIVDGQTIVASFAPNPVITTSAGPNGSITPPGPVMVNYGGSQTFTINPASNYNIYDVKVDGNSVGPLSSVPFTNVTGNHTISASFKAQTIKIVPDRTTFKIAYLKTAKFQVKLSDNPYANVTVAVAWQSGTPSNPSNPNIQVQDGASLTFNQDNWNTAQTVTLVSKTETGTTIYDRAFFQLSGDRVTSAQVTALWVENLPSVAPIMELLLNE